MVTENAAAGKREGRVLCAACRGIETLVSAGQSRRAWGGIEGIVRRGADGVGTLGATPAWCCRTCRGVRVAEVIPREALSNVRLSEAVAAVLSAPQCEIEVQRHAERLQDQHPVGVACQAIEALLMTGREDR
jgi:hypothetical protein